AAEAGVVLFNKIIRLISTTPALRATPPHLRRGAYNGNLQSDRPAKIFLFYPLIAYNVAPMVGSFACSLTIFLKVAARSCGCAKCYLRENFSAARSFPRFRWDSG